MRVAYDPSQHVDLTRELAHADVRHRCGRDLELETYSIEERRRLSYLFAEAWMHMIFRHGFFHADPHPSNIMVLEATEQIGLIDFGMVGKLTDEDMSRLTGLFIDAMNERIEALPKRLAALGVRYPREMEEEFVAELRDGLRFDRRWRQLPAQ